MSSQVAWHFKTISPVSVYWLKDFCVLEDLNSEYSIYSPVSAWSSLLFQDHLLLTPSLRTLSQLKCNPTDLKISVLEDYNSGHAVSSPVSPLSSLVFQDHPLSLTLTTLNCLQSKCNSSDLKTSVSGRPQQQLCTVSPVLSSLVACNFKTSLQYNLQPIQRTVPAHVQLYWLKDVPGDLNTEHAVSTSSVTIELPAISWPSPEYNSTDS